MGAVDLNFTMKTDNCTPTFTKTKGILLSLLTDTFKSPMLWSQCALTPELWFYYWCSELWWLEMGNEWPDGMLTPLCLRTILWHRQRMKNSGSMRPIMLLWVLPFLLLFLAVFEELAPRRRNFCVLWPMVIKLTCLALERNGLALLFVFPLLIAPTFAPSVYADFGGFGQGYCHVPYWSSSSSTYLPPSSDLCFQLPRRCRSPSKMPSTPSPFFFISKEGSTYFCIFCIWCSCLHNFAYFCIFDAYKCIEMHRRNTYGATAYFMHILCIFCAYFVHILICI